MSGTVGLKLWSSRTGGLLAAAALGGAGLTVATVAAGQPPPPPPGEAAPPPVEADADAGAAPAPLPTDLPPEGPPVAPPPGPPPAPPPPPAGPPAGPPPGPAGPYYGGPPPGQPPYGTWGAPMMPPPGPKQKPPPPDGQTEAGVPFAQRGRIAVDFAGYVSTEGGRGGRGASTNLVATIPITDRAMFETIVPLGLGWPWGNPSIGAHYVGKVGRQLWITGGGALGIPLLADAEDEYLAQMIPRALWNMQHHYPDIVPLQLRFGLEFHAAFFALRGQLEPSIWAPLGDGDDVHGSFQHAVEVQFGHSIGGGLRVQGVVVGPALFRGRGSADGDHYQLALSPFFQITRELGFLRTGLMLPMDEQLGPPFEQSWGFLVNTGLHID